MRTFLTAQEAAPLVGLSEWSLREKARRGAAPCRKIPGCRRVMFDPEELSAWADGAPLETVELPNGGRVVRPVAASPIDTRK